MQVSFIIPAHNVEKYILTTIKSIENLGFSDYEILVVDDCSTDKTNEIVTTYFEDHDNFHVFKTPSSKGYAGQPRNIGIENAKGEYVAFLDPDDFYVGTGMKVAFEKYYGYDIIVNSYAYAFYDKDHNVHVDRTYNLEVEEYDYKMHFLRDWKGIAAQRMLFKRTFLIDNNIRYNEVYPSQDTMILYDMMKFKPRVIKTDIFTTFYIFNREGSITNSYQNNERIFKGIEAMDYICQQTLDSDYSDEVKEMMMYQFSKWYYGKIKKYNDTEITKKIDSTTYFKKYKGD